MSNIESLKKKSSRKVFQTAIKYSNAERLSANNTSLNTRTPTQKVKNVYMINDDIDLNLLDLEDDKGIANFTKNKSKSLIGDNVTNEAFIAFKDLVERGSHTDYLINLLENDEDVRNIIPILRPHLCNIAVKSNNLDLLKYAREKNYPWNVETYKLAAARAKSNNLEILQYLCSDPEPNNRCPWNAEVCTRAAGNDNIEALKFLLTHDPPCPIDQTAIAIAAKYGKLDIIKYIRLTHPDMVLGPGILKFACSFSYNEANTKKKMEDRLEIQLEIFEYLYSEGCHGNHLTCAEASKNGHVRILQFLRDQTPPCPWSQISCEYAIANNHLDCLKFLRSNTNPDDRCPWSAICCRFAADKCSDCPEKYSEYLGILRFLRSENPPCPWDENTCYSAIIKNNVPLMQYLRSDINPNNRCPWDEKCCEYAARNLEMLKLLRSEDPPCPWDWHCSYEAARENNLEMLKFLRSDPNIDNRCPWGENCCEQAVRHKNYEMLKFLRSEDPPCPWNEEVCIKASAFNNLEMLKFLRSADPPCPWNIEVYYNAVDNNNFEMLKFIHSQNPDFEFDENVFGGAAESGNLEMIEYLYLHKCPYNETCCERAAGAGQLDVLKYLRSLEKPCPFTAEATTEAALYGYANCLEYLLSEGCDVDKELKNNPDITDECRKILYNYMEGGSNKKENDASKLIILCCITLLSSLIAS